jgi:malonyl-CoA O-methyltransferase
MSAVTSGFVRFVRFAGFARFTGFTRAATFATPAANPSNPSVSSNLDHRVAYALWAETYPPTAHNPLMRLEQKIVESILATVSATRALDVGTGSGRYLSVLTRTGAARIVGVDVSLAMLRRAPGGKVICADASHLPVRRSSFDVVNASLMVGDVENLAAWTREMARVLVRGGHLVYSDFHPSWAQHGWRRTFLDADGVEHLLGFVPHRIDDHLNAIEAAGLRVCAIREPRFHDDTDPDVRAFRHRWRNPPVVVVFHATKET